MISTWLPRSYIHLREAYSKLDQVNLKIKDVTFEEGLRFVISDFYKGTDAAFVFYPTGLMSVSMQIEKVKDLQNLVETVKEVIKESLIKNWHNVTYKQVQNKVIPLRYSAIVFETKEAPAPFAEDVEIEVTDTNLSDKSQRVWRSYQMAKILRLAMDHYMNLMADYYGRADKVTQSLKGKFELSDLKKTVFKMDFVEKTTGEVMARLADTQDCFGRELEYVELQKSNESVLGKELKLKPLFKQVGTDLEYISRLWVQMDAFLDNLDNASEARLSYQETEESRRVEWFLSIEGAGFIATLLLSVFVSEFTGINAIYLALGFVLSWFVIYYVLTRMRVK